MEYYWTLFNNGCSSTTCNAGSTTTASSSSTSSSFALNGNCSNTTFINPWLHYSWDLSFNGGGGGAATPDDPVYNFNDSTSDQHLTCLKLGKRHCFDTAAATESNKKGKTYHSDGVVIPPPSALAPTCQVEGCGAVLVNAKDYHRRHKVCETHAKSPKVTVNGVEQRFCQQCSRFHSVGEFDENKRSCRRRLAGHNERRRKSSQELRKPGPAGRHFDPLTTTSFLTPGIESRALSLLSSTSYYNPSSDLPARCSAALRELIAENRAYHCSPRPSWNSQFTTLNLMRARNSEFGFVSVNKGGKQSDDEEGEEGGGGGGSSGFWSVM